jgi:hypothetical protein
LETKGAAASPSMINVAGWIEGAPPQGQNGLRKNGSVLAGA